MHYSEDHLLVGHRTQSNTTVMLLNRKGRLTFFLTGKKKKKGKKNKNEQWAFDKIG